MNRPMSTLPPEGGVTELAEMARAAGLRRIHVLAWRDLADVEAGGSEVHAAEVLRRWADAGIDVTHVGCDPASPTGLALVAIDAAGQNQIIVVPGAFAQFTRNPTAQRISELFVPGSVWYVMLSAILIMFFTYFYTSIIFNPIDIAENLKKQGGFIPGVKPGARTAEYIDRVVTRITLPGALFLTVIALLPILISDMINVPFRFGGTSLLIVVGVGLDTVQVVQQQLLIRKYDGFMKKGARVRFRDRA